MQADVHDAWDSAADQHADSAHVEAIGLLQLPAALLDQFIWPRLGPHSRMQLRATCCAMRALTDSILPGTLHAVLQAYAAGLPAAGGEVDVHATLPDLAPLCSLLKRGSGHTVTSLELVLHPPKYEEGVGMMALQLGEDEDWDEYETSDDEVRVSLEAKLAAAAVAELGAASGGTLTTFSLTFAWGSECVLHPDLVAAISAAWPQLRVLKLDVGRAWESRHVDPVAWCPAFGSLPATLEHLEIRWPRGTAMAGSLESALRDHVAHISAPALRRLSLLDAVQAARVTAGVLRALPALEQLQQLEVAGAHVNDLNPVLGALPALMGLTSLELHDSVWLPDVQEVQQLLSGLPSSSNITSLSLPRSADKFHQAPHALLTHVHHLTAHAGLLGIDARFGLLTAVGALNHLRSVHILPHISIISQAPTHSLALQFFQASDSYTPHTLEAAMSLISPTCQLWLNTAAVSTLYDLQPEGSIAMVSQLASRPGGVHMTLPAGHTWRSMQLEGVCSLSTGAWHALASATEAPLLQAALCALLRRQRGLQLSSGMMSMLMSVHVQLQMDEVGKHQPLHPAIRPLTSYQLQHFALLRSSLSATQLLVVPFLDSASATEVGHLEQLLCGGWFPRLDTLMFQLTEHGFELRTQPAQGQGQGHQAPAHPREDALVSLLAAVAAHRADGGAGLRVVLLPFKPQLAQCLQLLGRLRARAPDPDTISLVHCG